jgi:hypothetical protein
MEIWTQADLDALKAARVALISGAAVQSVRYDGPPARQVTYHQADLPLMERSIALATASVRNATGSGSPFRFAASNKGLGGAHSGSGY